MNKHVYISVINVLNRQFYWCYIYFLYLASYYEYENIKIVKYLCSKNANVNAFQNLGETPLHYG